MQTTRDDVGGAGDGKRVLRYRPRTSDSLSSRVPSGDSSQWASPSRDDADYRDRMRTNAAAFLFTIALIGIGIWLAVTIADTQHAQECALTGRRSCAPISVPHR